MATQTAQVYRVGAPAGVQWFDVTWKQATSYCATDWFFEFCGCSPA
ncbi:hypothetical protein JOD64_005258 [Micromonospora luteifusca]|uniref:Uncharacterized protein n=1 Tax=Micromonospora luteifusca TaxID=709860 RepID=A0ABS2M0Q4_9ACTN|nr:hypothetical protein [Micromonospora luteifusca]MBM7494036.1 hypothetical protein [Micromonospora luteifusca]